MNFDEQRIYYSYQNLQQRQQNNDENDGLQEATDNLDEKDPDLQAVQRHCREFLSKIEGLYTLPGLTKY